MSRAVGPLTAITVTSEALQATVQKVRINQLSINFT